MADSIIFALVYLIAVLVPGYLMCIIFNMRDQVLLFSISLSLVFFVFTLAICFYSGLDITFFFWIYITGIAGLFVFAVLFWDEAHIPDKPVLAGSLVVAVATIVYLCLAGMFDELPSDVFRHLEFFKMVNKQIESGQFDEMTLAQLLGKPARYWYHLALLVSQVSGTDFLEQRAVFAGINVVLILCAIYSFSIWLFTTVIQVPFQLALTGVLSAFFFAAHTGIDTFAYIRYYAIAPTILAYIIYLTGIVVFTEYFRCKTPFLRSASLFVILFLTALLLHIQEAMFMATFFLVMSIVLFCKKTFTFAYKTGSTDTLPWRDSIFFITPVLLILTYAVYQFSLNFLEPETVSSPKLISLRALTGIDSDAVILNPNFQFYTVLTHWGLYIYLAWLFWYRRLFQDQPVLLSGMLIPVFTVFNPWFVEFFLRQAGTHVLWRYLYMLPLCFIAARLVTGLLSAPRGSLIRQFARVLAVLLCFALLLPVNTASIHLPYSRIYSLASVDAQARPAYWEDMVEFLNGLPDREVIVSDPITGYMISAITVHTSRRYKFYHQWMVDPYVFEDYSGHPLEKYNNRILVINRRKGVSTLNARISRHWHPDTLDFTLYYPQPLLDHVQAHPEHFELLWEADEIQVYRIRY